MDAVELKVGRSVMRFVTGDITATPADAIVNAANSGLMGGGGVDGAIHLAGGPSILEECRHIIDKIGSLPPGQAVITGGGRLPARFVIHTVGPVWHGGVRGEPAILSSAYRESLTLARDRKLDSVAFPSISTGAYGYPVREAAAIAVRTVHDFLKGSDAPMAVTFVLFDPYTSKAYEAAAAAIGTAA